MPETIKCPDCGSFNIVENDGVVECRDCGWSEENEAEEEESE